MIGTRDIAGHRGTNVPDVEVGHTGTQPYRGVPMSHLSQECEAHRQKATSGGRERKFKSQGRRTGVGQNLPQKQINVLDCSMWFFWPFLQIDLLRRSICNIGRSVRFLPVPQRPQPIDDRAVVGCRRLRHPFVGLALALLAVCPPLCAAPCHNQTEVECLLIAK